MNRRTLLTRTMGITALAAGAPLLLPLPRPFLMAATASTAGLADLGLPEVTISVDDAGFTVPTSAKAGRVLMTVANTGTKGLHFFAIRIPDEVGDEQLAAEMETDSEPPWFDMSKLAMLGTPDWPAPGGQAQGVVDLTAGRWLLVDPIEGRDVAVLAVGAGAPLGAAPEPTATVELELVEMAFTGLGAVVPAGPTIWKIANRGALMHEIALLPVPNGSTPENVLEAIAEMLQGAGDPAFFAPVAGQGIASAGVTSWQEFDLAAGTYAAVCMSPMPGEEYVPHAAEGMVGVFAVR